MKLVANRHPLTLPDPDPWQRRLLTMKEAAEYLRYTSGHSAYTFLTRHGVKLYKRGQHMLVRGGDIDRVLEQTATADCVDVRVAKGRR